MGRICNCTLRSISKFRMRQMDTVFFLLARTRVVDHTSAFPSQDASMHICIQSASDWRPTYSAGFVFATFLLLCSFRFMPCTLFVSAPLFRWWELSWRHLRGPASSIALAEVMATARRTEAKAEARAAVKQILWLKVASIPRLVLDLDGLAKGQEKGHQPPLLQLRNWCLLVLLGQGQPALARIFHYGPL